MAQIQQISIRNAPNAKTGLRDLCEYINDRHNTKNLTLLEIGSYAGDSAAIFAGYFGKVLCVDPWINGYDQADAASYQYHMSAVERQFDENLSAFTNVTKYKMSSMEFAKKSYPEKFDVVYIDAVHTYQGCKNDIILFKDRIRENGFLCGHDFQNKFQGVKKAVLELGEPEKIFSDTSWLFQINKL